MADRVKTPEKKKKKDNRKEDRQMDSKGKKFSFLHWNSNLVYPTKFMTIYTYMYIYVNLPFYIQDGQKNRETYF